MSDLIIQIIRKDEPQCVLDEFTIIEEEFHDQAAWEPVIIQNIKSAIRWETKNERGRDSGVNCRGVEEN